MFRSRANVYVAALIACAATAAAVADSSQSSRSITLEIIVKFSRDSDTGRRILDMLENDPQELDRLGDLGGALRQSTGFELVPVRITSGRELLLRVPEAPALEKVKQTVTRHPQVSSAALIAIQDENPRLPQSMLLVHFHPSTAESELLGKAYASDAYAADVQALTAGICAGSGVPVLGSARAGAVLAIQVDRKALLDELVTRLKSLAEVDYAQPNASVEPMN